MERPFYFAGAAKRVINVMANRHLGYSVRRRYIDEFYAHHVSALPVGCTLLDVGGNKINKRGQFDLSQYPVQVVYVNLSGQKKPDVQADAAFLPLSESSFEYVICAELLEHVPDPERVLQEFYRIMVPGGKLLMTVPFLYPIHADPYDYGRYTDFFWKHALRVAGFEPFDIERQGTFHTVLLMYAKLFMNRFWRRPFRWFAAPFVSGAESLLRWYERRNKVRDDPFLTSFTTGFGVVAVKPEKIES
jgi:SAM-dependent methyltransferase